MTFDTYRAALLQRRRELDEQLRRAERTLDETPPADWEDRSSERQGDEVLETLGQSELREIRRIDAALGRIDAGTYGTCSTCGAPIGEARLALLPDTPFCKSCAP
ncbi:TraR/DksA family transcriptional regulator [Oceaniglobus roseus]|uniref:TraR/DksA family transcriptional regulator n=1 Tax=Oceaniglobus roseus TaxID=1737570 RepID=UPI000C7EA648|nr:TraR/DksA family transcriptional regulator [Kandeliimicrobium roseum]